MAAACVCGARGEAREWRKLGPRTRRSAALLHTPAQARAPLQLPVRPQEALQPELDESGGLEPEEAKLADELAVSFMQKGGGSGGQQ